MRVLRGHAVVEVTGCPVLEPRGQVTAHTGRTRRTGARVQTPLPPKERGDGLSSVRLALAAVAAQDLSGAFEVVVGA